jgi:predicted RNase H-like nuclease (RuvC/YqgF family)
MNNMHFGPMDREEEVPEDVKIAKKVRDQTATIVGCSTELQIQKQQIKHLSERIDSLQNQMMTLMQEVKMLRELHAQHLQSVLNGGPTE